MGSDKMRKEASKISKKTLDQAAAKVGERLLYTDFHFQINRICGNMEFSHAMQKALVNISWDGWTVKNSLLPESTAGNDTSTFKWKEAADSVVDVNRECHVPILTRHRKPAGLKWQLVDDQELTEQCLGTRDWPTVDGPDGPQVLPQREELVNGSLAKTLASTSLTSHKNNATRWADLTQEQWDAFGISSLRTRHFVNAGGRVFIPIVEPWSDLQPFKIAVMMIPAGKNPLLSSATTAVSADFSKGVKMVAAGMNKCMTYPRANAEWGE